MSFGTTLKYASSTVHGFGLGAARKNFVIGLLCVCTLPMNNIIITYEPGHNNNL